MFENQLGNEPRWIRLNKMFSCLARTWILILKWKVSLSLPFLFFFFYVVGWAEKESPYYPLACHNDKACREIAKHWLWEYLLTGVEAICHRPCTRLHVSYTALHKSLLGVIQYIFLKAVVSQCFGSIDKAQHICLLIDINDDIYICLDKLLIQKEKFFGWSNK